ncbi:MAG TPA: DUF488 family protein [Thermoanaerobaculia bacterium]|nr:DUF488 family protein [Thermoanaerobaculia bacterium]
MSIRIVRLGEPRLPEEGIRLGTVRRPPRGVRKEDYGRLDFFDLWLPDLAPSAELVKLALSESLTEQGWARFVKGYRREMKEPGAERLLKLLALLSHQTGFSVGCYCENEDRCHRSILRELLLEHGADVR